nr:MAG TPA: hypothetical protein [Caudoviricetes sp.]
MVPSLKAAVSTVSGALFIAVSFMVLSPSWLWSAKYKLFLTGI